MDYSVVVKQFYEREGAHNDKFRLNAVVIPDGTFRGRTLLEIVPNRSVYVPTQPFRLLDIPTELRLRIYGYVLILGEEGQVTLDRYVWRPTPDEDTRQKCVTKGFKRTHNSPWHKDLMWAKKEAKWVGGEPNPFSLLLVNKQINAEATPVAYNSNCFKIMSLPIAQSFVQTVGANLKHLTMIHLQTVSLPTFEKTLKVLSDADGLRTLCLSDTFVLNELRYKAKNQKDVSSWAEVLNHAIKGLLLAVQVTNRARDRKWLALDVVQIHYEKNDSPYYKPTREEERQKKKQLQGFLEAFRKIANEYLREE